MHRADHCITRTGHDLASVYQQSTWYNGIKRRGQNRDKKFVFEG